MSGNSKKDSATVAFLNVVSVVFLIIAVGSVLFWLEGTVDFFDIVGYFMFAAGFRAFAKIIELLTNIDQNIAIIADRRN